MITLFTGLSVELLLTCGMGQRQPLKQETIGIIFTRSISTTLFLHPSLCPPKIQDDSTNATNRKFQKLFRSTLIKCDRINFVVLNTFLTVFFFFLKLAKQIKFQFYSCRMLHLNPSFHRSHSGVNFLLGCLWNSPAIKWAWFFLLAQIALWRA